MGVTAFLIKHPATPICFLKCENLSTHIFAGKHKVGFQKLGWIYDTWGKLTESKANKELLDLAKIKNGEQVLEVACGTGEVFREIVKSNPDGENRGLDLAPAMLSKAREKLKQARLSNFNLQEANALNLPFETDRFGILINSYIDDLLPGEKFSEVAREFYRVLRP